MQTTRQAFTITPAPAALDEYGYRIATRSIGKCPVKACGKVKAVDNPNLKIALCECGQKIKMSAIIGEHSNVTCGSKCTGATGFTCDCSCGGENHGMNHL